MVSPSWEIYVGWISIGAIIAGLILYSIGFVSFYHHPQQTHWVHKVICILALVAAVLPCMFLPVDVYMTSALKNADGTLKPWADTPEKQMIYLNPITDGYYGLFAIVIMSLFLFIPFCFFFKPSNEAFSVRSHEAVVKALKFVFFTAILCIILFIIGIFLPWNGVSPDSISERCRSAVFLIMNILCVIGFSLITTYLSYGTVSWPFAWIFGRYGSRKTLEKLSNRKEEVTNEIKNLDGTTESQNKIQLLRKELEIINLKIRTYQNDDGILHHLLVKLRPLQILYGSILAAIGFIIFISILLNNIDRAINSMGLKSGYYLKSRNLPNPLDYLLTHCHFLYPIDLFILVLIIHFFIFSTIEGLKAIGSRCLWIQLFQLKPRKTPAHSLSLLCGLLTLIVLALLPFIFQITPQYCTFGPQHYQLLNETKPLVCTNDSPEDFCIPTRLSVLIRDFYSDGWIFGAIYYWLSWLYLVITILSTVIVLIKMRYVDDVQPSSLDESTDADDDPLLQA